MDMLAIEAGSGRAVFDRTTLLHTWYYRMYRLKMTRRIKALGRTTLDDFAQILGVETLVLQGLINRDFPLVQQPGRARKARRQDAPRTQVSASRGQKPR
jgi:hypothetical protein